MIIKYDFGFQYLQFRKDIWWDNIQLSSGDIGPPVEVVNSEKSYALVSGPRIMLPMRGGFIWPYMGIKGGFSGFMKKILGLSRWWSFFPR